eukprot:364216-Chlamydomonas_euryale.AAC.1
MRSLRTARGATFCRMHMCLCTRRDQPSCSARVSHPGCFLHVTLRACFVLTQTAEPPAADRAAAFGHYLHKLHVHVPVHACAGPFPADAVCQVAHPAGRGQHAEAARGAEQRDQRDDAGHPPEPHGVPGHPGVEGDIQVWEGHGASEREHGGGYMPPARQPPSGAACQAATL